MAVPYTFGSATTSIPLSQLDSNFATTITLGNTAIQLGNTVTTLNNMTLANVTVSSVASTFPNNFLGNSSVTIGSTAVALGSTVTSFSGLTALNFASGTNGITFNNSSATTNSTLNDYEYGTFTVTDASGAGLTFSANTGYYTKVGRLVTISFDPVWPTTSNTAQASISLPFTAVTSGKGGAGAIGYTTVSGGVTAYLGATSAITIYALGTGGLITNSQLSTKELAVVFTYQASF